MWFLYQIAFGLSLLLAAPFLLVRRGGHYWPTLAGRLGSHRGPVVRGALWLHAVSVGEVGVAATLARHLPPDLPLLITTVTPTGQERARALLGQRASVAYLPLDLGLPISRFLRRFSPRALVLVEGDYWPLLLRAVRRRGLPVAVVNGRVGDRSFRRLERLRPFLGPLFGPVDRFGLQGPGDRDRLRTLGVPEEKLSVTGNLKYDSPEPQRKPELEASLRRLADGRPILVAGSTMAGEEEAVVAAFEALSGGGRALLLLAPRHPERWAEVEKFLDRGPLPWVRRSRLDGGPAASPAPGPAVVLLDSLGELAGLYSLAAAAFIGGTLVPTGGHNPLEAARFGVPVAVGPSMHNFRQMAEEFDAADAWQRVKDAGELAAAWRRWLDDPAAAEAQGARGAALVERNRGAVEQTLRLLEPLLKSLQSLPA